MLTQWVTWDMSLECDDCDRGSPGSWGGWWGTPWRRLWEGFRSSGRAWVGRRRAHVGSGVSAPDWRGALPWLYPCALSLPGGLSFYKGEEETATKRADKRRGHRDSQKTGSAALETCGEDTQLWAWPGRTVSSTVVGGLTSLPGIPGASFGDSGSFPSWEFLNSLKMNHIFI